MNKQRRADMMLLFVAFSWGISYFLLTVCFKELGTFTLNAFRFCGAFLVAAIIFFPKLKGISKETIKYSVIIGTVLFFVYMCTTFGTKYTTVSNAGFLCGMTVAFTPIFNLILFKKKPDKKVLVAIFLCIIGIALLTLKDDFTINLANLKGDLLCITCSIFYAIHLIFTEQGVSNEKVDPLKLGILQLGVTGIWNLALAFIIEEPAFPKTMEVWNAILFLTIICTGMAFIIQTIAQKDTTASHVGVIFTLEPVFNTIFAIFLIDEILTFKSYVGGALMFFAIICMETGVIDRFLKKGELR